MARFHILRSLVSIMCLFLDTFVTGVPTKTTVFTTELAGTEVSSTTAKIDYKITTKFPLEVGNIELKATSATATLPTKKTKVTATTASTPRRAPNEDAPLYRLNGSNGQACILLQVDALIKVQYKTVIGESEEADIYVPDDAKVGGHCDDEKYVTMTLKWDTFVLAWSFAKTPGGERWYVDKIELTYNSSDKHFIHIDQPDKTVRLSSAKHGSMFPTPVGKSFVCSDEQTIDLSDGKKTATVIVREMKLQPFKFKNNEFAAEFSCSSLSARANRSETAPLVVGSTLAFAVLLTISGYAGYRQFRVKQTNYDTMQT